MYYCKKCRSWSFDGRTPHQSFVLRVTKAYIRSCIERGIQITPIQASLLDREELCYGEMDYYYDRHVG